MIAAMARLPFPLSSGCFVLRHDRRARGMSRLPFTACRVSMTFGLRGQNTPWIAATS